MALEVDDLARRRIVRAHVRRVLSGARVSYVGKNLRDDLRLSINLVFSDAFELRLVALTQPRLQLTARRDTSRRVRTAVAEVVLERHSIVRLLTLAWSPARNTTLLSYDDVLLVLNSAHLAG